MNPPTYHSGQLIGGEWRVVKAMRGGFGAAYVVERDADVLVLKTPLEPSLKQMEAFRAEAEVWVRLGAHPNIVQAFWVDQIAGRVFVGVEYVAPNEIGCTSVRDFLQFGQLPTTVVARWAADFCHGLKHAVQRGLVCHRDIKPENLLVDGGDFLKISDFGLAHAYASESGPKAAKIGQWKGRGDPVIGTPPYMSPEQITGDSISIPSDIYAFGITLFEMAFGARPFQGRTSEEIFRAHLHEKPKIPDHPLAGIIARSLDKRPKRRYHGPEELLADLTAACGKGGIILPPAPHVDNTRLMELRARAHSFAALGQRREAIYCARALVSEAPDDSTAWTQLGRLLLEDGSLDEAEQATRRSLELDPTRSPAWNNLGVILGRRGENATAMRAFNQSLLANPFNTGAMLNLAPKWAHSGEAFKAIELLKRATTLAPDKPGILNNLGALYIQVGERTRAIEVLERALSLDPANETICTNLNTGRGLPETNSGVANLAAGNLPRAIRGLLRETEAEPAKVDGWHNLGLAYLTAGENAAARECFHRVVQLHPRDGFAVCRLIELAALAGDLADAERWCNALAALPDGKVASIAFHGRALEACGKLQEAKKLLTDAIRSHPGEPDLCVALADIAAKYKQRHIAVPLYARAVTLLKARSASFDRVREIEERRLSIINESN